MKTKIIAYHDRGKRGYQDIVEVLVASLNRFSLDYTVVEVPEFKTWHQGVMHKPTFIREQMKIHREYDGLLYVDADAQFIRNPSFKMLENVHVGVHYFQRSKHHKIEALTGTLWFANTPTVWNLLDEWISVTANFSQSQTPEQDSLKHILQKHMKKGLLVGNLPPEWCWIVDDFLLKYGKDRKPVIVHYQASRKSRLKDKT